MSTNNFVENTKNYFEKNTVPFINKYYVFDDVDSTNSMAKQIAEKGDADKTFVLAYTQRDGRGRFTRPWESPEGGLYCSLVLKPEIATKHTTLLPLVAAVAIAKTLRHFGLSSMIKWPNDVRVNKKKISGILLESTVYQNNPQYVIIGIGVNLNSSLNQFSPELKNIVTSVKNELNKLIDYYVFLFTFLLNVEKYYTEFTNNNFESIISEWKNLSDTLHRTVKIGTQSQDIIGEAVDIDRFGFLIIETKTGEKKKIMSGDCLYYSEL